MAYNFHKAHSILGKQRRPFIYAITPQKPIEENLMTDAKTQSDKFKEAAREQGTDENEKRFEEMLRKVAKRVPPKPK